MSDQKAQLVEAFHQMCDELLENLSLAFPECQNTKISLTMHRDRKSDDAFQNTIVREWHQAVRPHYQDIARFEIEKCININHYFFTLIELKKKLTDPGFSRENQKIFFEYLHQLDMIAQLYHGETPTQQVESQVASQGECAGETCSLQTTVPGTDLSAPIDFEELRSIPGKHNDLLNGIPSDVLKNVQSTVSEFSSIFSGNPESMAEMNPEEIQGMVQSIFNGVSEDSLMQLQNNLPAMLANMQSMMNDPEIKSAMDSMQGQGIPGVPQGFNPFDMMNQLSKMAPQ